MHGTLFFVGFRSRGQSESTDEHPVLSKSPKWLARVLTRFRRTRRKRTVHGDCAPRSNHDFTSLLPTELALSIINHLKQDIPTLRYCRLVSRAWNKIFTPLAFDRTVVFLVDKESPSRYRGYKTMHKLYKHITRHPAISQHIRFIDFRDSRAFEWENLSRAAEADTFFRILLSLPNLEQVAYSGPPLIGRVRFESLPNIKSRTLNCVRLHVLKGECQSSWDPFLPGFVCNLLQVFVAIDTLTVARTPRFRSVASTGTGMSLMRTQRQNRGNPTATADNPDSELHLIRAIELERISLHNPQPRDSTSSRRDDIWLQGLQALRIAELDTRKVHELSAFLQHTSSLYTLDIAKLVYKQPGRNHGNSLIDLSACARLQRVRVSIPVSISRNAHIWRDLVRMLISPLAHSSRADPIRLIRLSFRLDRNLWDATNSEPEFEEERFAEFEAGLKLLCAACVRVRRTGAVQHIFLKAHLEDYEAVSGQVTEGALASGKRFKDIWRANTTAHVMLMSSSR